MTPKSALHADGAQDSPPDSSSGTKYRTIFKAGIEKLGLGKAQEAADLLREALRLRAAADEEVRINSNFYEPYAPNYFLSVALLKLNDCSGAQRALAVAETSVSEAKLKKQREALMQRCR